MKTKFNSRIPFKLDPGRKIPKENSKKIQKLIKPLPGIIFNPNGMRKAKKVKRKFYFRISFVLDPGMKIPKKNSKKIQKII